MRRFVAAGAAVATIAALTPAVTSAALRPARCSPIYDPPGARCATLNVPIDRTGKVAGTTRLFVERVRGAKPSKNAIAFFPGGPGASASLLGNIELPAVRAGMEDHDLLLFDQRGTGRSDYLDCDVALTPTDYVPAVSATQQLAKTVERCAHRLGPKRAFYTTHETVEDLEDVRKAEGIDKLILVGVSYGSRDVMSYARAYPE